MSSTQIHRERLQNRLAELVKRHDALQKHLRGNDGRLEADFSDRVAFTEMDEVLEQLDDTARGDITSIQAALMRLDAGTYGECAECGETIPEKRLEAIPTTPFCTSCAASHES